MAYDGDACVITIVMAAVIKIMLRGIMCFSLCYIGYILHVHSGFEFALVSVVMR